MADALYFCPRCDRKYTGDTLAEVKAVVEKHVELQHPDHDPDWGKE
jgi:hypothetical protein